MVSHLALYTLLQRMIYPKELLSSTGLTEASTRGIEEKYTGWGTIWSMTFVGMPDDHITSTAKSESLLLLVALVHRSVHLFHGYKCCGSSVFKFLIFYPVFCPFEVLVI